VRNHITSTYEFQTAGLLLAGPGEHTIRVLGAAAVVELNPGLLSKEEQSPAPFSLYERYYAGELAGAQEDGESRPFFPRVPALFVTQAGEKIFLERDWSGLNIADEAIPALPDTPDAGATA